jgi:hypothetical protein
MKTGRIREVSLNILRVLSVVALCFVFPRPSFADGLNLVTSGGFETGNFTDWTVTPGADPLICGAAVGSLGQIVTCGLVVTPFPWAAHSGNYSAGFGNDHASTPGVNNTISQTLSTNPTSTYDLAFWLFNFNSPGFGSTPNGFTAQFGGQTLLNLTNAASFGWTEYTFDNLSPSSSTVLSFTGWSGPARFGVDDVSVVATPEPPSLLLIGVGLIALLPRRKRGHILNFAGLK